MDNTTTKKENLVFINFVGEVVEVIVKSTQKVIHGDSESVDESTHPLALQGYFLDEDNQYFFLGDTPNKINKAVKKSEVVCIQMLHQETRDLFESILDEMPVPDSDDEKN